MLRRSFLGLTALAPAAALAFQSEKSKLKITSVRLVTNPERMVLRETQRAVIAIQRLTPIRFAAQFGQLPEQAEAQLAELTHRLIVRALERRPRTLVASPR